MRGWKSAIITVGALSVVLGACEDRAPVEQEPEGEEHPQAPDLPEPTEPEEPAEEEPWVPEEEDFLSWPGHQQQMTFGLTWLGGDGEVVLRDDPRPDAEEIGVASWYDGDPVEWLDSRIYVARPRPYEVVEERELVATIYYAPIDELALEERTFSLEADEVVYLYLYAGEGGCYLGVKERLVLAACPEDGFEVLDEEGLDVAEEIGPRQDWKPLEELWWVQVENQEGVQGWFQVDEAPVDIHLRGVEGYDEFELDDGDHGPMGRDE